MIQPAINALVIAKFATIIPLATNARKATAILS